MPRGGKRRRRRRNLQSVTAFASPAFSNCHIRGIAAKDKRPCKPRTISYVNRFEDETKSSMKREMQTKKCRNHNIHEKFPASNFHFTFALVHTTRWCCDESLIRLQRNRVFRWENAEVHFTSSLSNSKELSNFHPDTHIQIVINEHAIEISV